MLRSQFSTRLETQTSFYIEYRNQQTISGYATVNVLRATNIDSSLDTAMKIASNNNILVCYGDISYKSTHKSIADYIKQYGNSDSDNDDDNYNNNNYDYYNNKNGDHKLTSGEIAGIAIVVVAVLGVLALAFFCYVSTTNEPCCCYAEEKPKNDNVLQSDLIPTNPSFIASGNPYEVQP